MPFGRYTQWRWVISDLDGVTITTLDRRARDRSISREMHRPSSINGVVSSDDREINRIHPDGFPFLAEGDRLLYALRRDYGAGPFDDPARAGGLTGPWYPRASGIILQYDDQGEESVGNSTFTAYDPWEYLNHLPLPNPNDIDLTGNLNTRYVRTRVNDIITSILANASIVYNTTWGPLSGPTNMFLDWGWSPQYAGTIETLPIITHTFPKGQTIGEGFIALCERGRCDIVITPIYDPVNRPGILAELSIYETAGEQRAEAIFAWDKPSHSTSTVSRLVDGTRRKNVLRLHATQGGPSASTDYEMASVNRFGEYWSEEFLVAEEHTVSLEEYEQDLIDTYSEHARSVSIGAVPERSPEPFLEYDLFDEVRVFASPNLRATMSGFQRVSGLTVALSDDQLETVSDLRIYIPGEGGT